jgi:hypothetical protein
MKVIKSQKAFGKTDEQIYFQLSHQFITSFKSQSKTINSFLLSSESEYVQEYAKQNTWFKPSSSAQYLIMNKSVKIYSDKTKYIGLPNVDITFQELGIFEHINITFQSITGLKPTSENQKDATEYPRICESLQFIKKNPN